MIDDIKVPSARDLGVLVSMHAKGAGGIHKEKEVTKEVQKQKNVEADDLVNVTSSMFQKSFVKPWEDQKVSLKNYIDSIAPPFGHDGKRFLANGLLDKFQAEVERRLIVCDQLREQFMDGLDEARRRWETKGGDISKNSQRRFPTRADMEDKLRIEIDYVQCSDDADVRLGGLSGEQRDRYESEVKQAHQKKMQGVVRHIAKKVEERVGLVLEKTGAPEKGGFVPKRGKGTKQQNGFKNSLIENCKELAGFLEHWNVTQDPEVEKVRRKLLTDLATFDPAELKKDPQLRKEAHAAAEDILSRVGNFGRQNQ